MSDLVVCPVCMEDIESDEGGLACDACDTHVCDECLCGVLVDKKGNWQPDEEGVGNHNLCSPCYKHVDADASLSDGDDDCWCASCGETNMSEEPVFKHKTVCLPVAEITAGEKHKGLSHSLEDTCPDCCPEEWQQFAQKLAEPKKKQSRRLIIVAN